MTCSSSFWSLSVSDKTLLLEFDNKREMGYNTFIETQMEQKMKPYTFTYLHVPPQFKITMGLDKIENRSVTINANSKAEAQKLFDLMMSDI
jgi:hypothetical protein